MEVMSPSQENLGRAVQILREGGVIAHATETCYGYACDVKNLNAVEKLFAVKERPEDMPVSVLFSDIDAAKEYVKWNKEADHLSKKHLPGPLTLILPIQEKWQGKIFLSPKGENLTIGVRISSDPIAAQIAQKFGGPLSTTSANIHSEPNPYSPTDITKQINGWVEPDLIVDSGVLDHTESSTVVDLAGDEIKVLRQGDISI